MDFDQLLANAASKIVLPKPKVRVPLISGEGDVYQESRVPVVDGGIVDYASAMVSILWGEETRMGIVFYGFTGPDGTRTRGEIMKCSRALGFDYYADAAEVLGERFGNEAHYDADVYNALVEKGFIKLAAEAKGITKRKGPMGFQRWLALSVDLSAIDTTVLFEDGRFALLKKMEGKEIEAARGGHA